MLRVARELLGESQDSLAPQLGLKKRAIQRVEASTPSLSLDRQNLFIEHFRMRGLVFTPPEDNQAGWSVTETFSCGEQTAPGRLFRAARIGLDMSQEALSAEANLATMTVRRIEAGKETVELETRQFLIDHLEVRGIQFLFPSETAGWGIRFTTMPGDHKAWHPRLNVQKRKQSKLQK
ncbi:helix-turn-helix transcriptional regulator [Rhizobium ruizarguesonis]